MKSKPAPRLLLLILAVLAIAPLASAHPGHGPAQGFAAGAIHPFSGWDHILAMIAVGLWAVQLGARWRVPAAFIGMMTVGAAAGHWTGAVPWIEPGIAVSVLVLGLLIANAVRLPVASSMALVGFFAIFHGAAHGAEMPATAAGLGYGAGFVMATALLHAAGVALGMLAGRQSARMPQLAGWTIAAAGAALLALSFALGNGL